MNYKLLLISIVLFPLIDYLYLTNVISHYSNLIKTITKEEIKFNMTKAIGAYIFLIIGLYYFILKDLKEENLREKIVSAMILGWVIYGTYDFTSGAILKDYDWYTMLMDTTWGGILYGLVTWLTFEISLFI